MTEIEVLEGALMLFRREGVKAGGYWPCKYSAGYCAIGGLIRAAGGPQNACYSEGLSGVAKLSSSRERFLADHPEVVKAHARLEAHLGKTFDELRACSPYDKPRHKAEANDILRGYGGSLLEFWVEQCSPDPEQIIDLFWRALCEARADAIARVGEFTNA